MLAPPLRRFVLIMIDQYFPACDSEKLELAKRKYLSFELGGVIERTPLKVYIAIQHRRIISIRCCLLVESPV